MLPPDLTRPLTKPVPNYIEIVLEGVIALALFLVLLVPWLIF